MGKNLEGGGHKLDNGMIVSGEIYDIVDKKAENIINVKKTEIIKSGNDGVDIEGKISETEKAEDNGVDNSNAIKKLEDEIASIQARIEVGGKKNNIIKLTKRLEATKKELALLEDKNKDVSKFWPGDRSKWQKDAIKESREVVKAAKKLRDQDNAKKDIPEIISANEGKEIEIKTLEEKKARLKEDLNTLNTVFENSKKRDPNFSKGLERDASLDDPEETGRRAKIGIKMTEAREKISEIDKEIKGLSGTGDIKADIKKEEEKSTQTINVKPLNLENMEKNIGEDSGFDVYAKVNKESALKAEQEKAEEAYRADFQNREKTSGNEKNEWEKLREKDDLEKEKRAGEFKKEEEKIQEEKDRITSYKRQFGEEDIDTKSSEKPDISSVNTGDNIPTDVSEKQIKEKLERSKNLPEDEKEKMREAMMDEEMKRMSDQYPLDELRDKNQYQEKKIFELEKTIEIKQLNTVEAMVKADEVIDKIDTATQELRSKIDKKDLSRLEKIWKDPKFKLVLAGAFLTGADILLTGGTTAPLYWGAKAAIVKVFPTFALPSAYGTSGVIGGGAIAAGRWFLEKIGVVKNESDVEKAVKEYVEKIDEIKNSRNEQLAVGGTLGETPAETPVKKEGFLGKIKNIKNKIFGGKKEKSESAEIQDAVINSETYTGMIDKFRDDFNSGKIGGEEIYKKANVFRNWMEIELAGKKGMQDAVVKKIHGIDSEVQAKMVNLMLEYAIANNKDNKEIADRVRHLTMRPDLNEIINIPGISEATKQWLKREQEAEAAGEKQEENREMYYDIELNEALKKEFRGIESFMEKLNEDKIEGSEAFAFAKHIDDLSKSFKKEEMKIIAHKIFSYDDKIRARAINLLVEYARNEKKKPEDVYGYAQTFAFSMDGVNIANYEWLTGEKMNLKVDGWQTKEGMAVYSVDSQKLENIKLFTQDIGEGRWDTALATIIEIAKEDFPSIPSFNEIASYDRSVENDGKRNIFKIEMRTETKIISMIVGIDEERKNIAVSDVIEKVKENDSDKSPKPPVEVGVGKGVKIKESSEVKNMTLEEVHSELKRTVDILNKMAEGLSKREFEILKETKEDYKKLYNYIQSVLTEQWVAKNKEEEFKKIDKEKSNAVSVEDAVKYFEENKDKSNDELNLGEIKKMMKAIMPGTTKNLINFLVRKEKRRNNDIYDWLWEKKKEIEKAQKEDAERLIFNFNKKITNSVERFKSGEIDGEGVYKFADEVREFLESPAATDSTDVRFGYTEALYKIDSETQAKMIGAMAEFAMSKKIDSEEILNLSKLLTYKTEEELKNLEGIDENTMKWLTTGEK